MFDKPLHMVFCSLFGYFAGEVESSERRDHNFVPSLAIAAAIRRARQRPQSRRTKRLINLASKLRGSGVAHTVNGTEITCKIYCSFAYSTLACFRTGTSASASFHNA